MKRIFASLAGVLLLCAFVWLAQSGIIQWLGDFFAWYINFQVTTSDLNNTFVLIGKIMTWVISYGAVGIFFNFLGWFNSKAMSITYNVISFILNIILTLILKFYTRLCCHHCHRFNSHYYSIGYHLDYHDNQEF